MNMTDHDEWGRGRRSMARTTSKDLMTWTPSVPMTYGDTPREQFYTNNTQPYFRAPHIYVAPAARCMEGRQAITPAQAAALGVKRIGPHVYFKDCSDAVLLTSRAGSTVYDRTFPEIIGDEIERIVAWKQGTDVSRLAGQPVRLRFVMKDADLYSTGFTRGE